VELAEIDESWPAAIAWPDRPVVILVEAGHTILAGSSPR
jgi:hypothetical protein